MARLLRYDHLLTLHITSRDYIAVQIVWYKYIGLCYSYGVVIVFYNKNSSGDEIANVNFFTTISHTYFKTPKREPISFNKLNDS